ncbi:MAG: hypothetical protein ACSLFP_00240 [Acidimicrobiales bacterium]
MALRQGWGLVLAAMSAGAAAPSSAQDPPAVPVVQITSVSPVVASYSCGDIDATVTPGEVTFARTGGLGESLEVAFETTEAHGPRVRSTTFQPPDATAPTFVGLVSAVPDGPILVTLLDGDGYDLGQPATATVPVDDSAVERGCPPYEPPAAPEPPTVEPTFTG